MFSKLRRQFGRLSIRLTLWHTALFLAAALTVLSLSYAVIHQRLDSQEHDVIELRLNQYVGEYERNGLTGIHLLAALRKGREQKAFFVRLADPHNQTIFLRDSEDWAEFLPDQLARKLPPAGENRGWMTLESPSRSVLLLAYARLKDGSILHVGKTTEGLQDILTGFRTAAVVVLLIFIPASIAGGAFLVSRALRPVQHLTSVAQQIVKTASFDARVPMVGSRDELDALVAVFNEMLGRIQRLIRGMSDSLDDVAHDLRTPMTRLRQKAQSALEADADLEMARDALADCVEEAERVMTLLNTLMDIAETESGLVNVPRLPVAVQDLVHSAVDSYSEVAEEKQVTVSSQIEADLTVQGDAGALRRVFANLLDNAIKYTPAGGRVRITGESAGEMALIHFSDTGCGISPEDLPRIWDRLFRADRSRSAHGLGLGLSFVRAIVESHGGTASVTSQIDAGTRATIRLPLITAERGDE